MTSMSREAPLGMVPVLVTIVPSASRNSTSQSAGSGVTSDRL